MDSLPEYVILWILQRLNLADRRVAAATCRKWAAVADWPEAWDDMRNAARVDALEATLSFAGSSVDRARAAVVRLRITPGLLCKTRDNYQRGAIQWPIRAGNVPVALWFIDTYGFPRCGLQPPVNPDELLSWACQEGHLHMVEALYERYSPKLGHEVVEATAAGGNYDIMRWLVAHMKSPSRAIATPQAVYLACVHGHLRFVHEFFAPIDWGNAAFWDVGREDLFDRTPPQDEFSGLTLVRAAERTFIEVCRRGHFEMAQWLAADPLLNICDTVYHAAVEAACSGGHLPIVQLLVKDTRWNDDALMGAAYGGHTHVLQWMFAQLDGRAARFDLFVAACSAGRLATAQWLAGDMDYLRETSLYRNYADKLLYVPLAGGHLHLARWLVDTYPNDLNCAHVRRALDDARSLEAIRWLVGICRARDFDEPSPTTVRRLVERACARGDIESFRWLEVDFEVDFPTGEDNSLFQIACSGGNYELARWIACQYSSSHTSAIARRIAGDLCFYGHGDIVKWMVSLGWLPRCHAAAMFQRACQGGELHLVRWLRERYEILWDDIRDFVARPGYLQCHVSEWLRATYSESRDGLAACPQNDRAGFGGVFTNLLDLGGAEDFDGAFDVHSDDFDDGAFDLHSDDFDDGNLE